MGESDVILNELKHINKQLEELKNDYKQTQQIVFEMNGEKKYREWGIPILVSALFAFISSKAKGG